MVRLPPLTPPDSTRLENTLMYNDSDGAPQRPNRIDRTIGSNYRSLRSALTAGSILTMFVCVGAFAFLLGSGGLWQTPIAIGVLALAALFTAQQPGFYRSLDRARDNRALLREQNAEQEKPKKTKNKNQVHKLGFSERRRRPAVPQPHPMLGGDFAFIVREARELTDEQADELRVQLDGIVDGEAYDDACDSVLEKLRLIEHYAELGQAGFDDSRNAGLFIEELDEQVSPAAAMVAALIAVKDHYQVPGDTADQIMNPWVGARLPVMWGGGMYESDGEQDVPVPVYQDEDDAELMRQATAAPAELGDASIPPAPLPRRESVPVNPELAALATASPIEMEQIVSSAEREGLTYTVEQLAHAAELILRSQFGSMHMLMRKMQVSFTTAAHLMERLEQLALVAKPKKAGAAYEVLEGPETTDDTVKWILDQKS
jgi:hypothetical protein